MFYSNQPVEKPLPKPLPLDPLERKHNEPSKALNSLLGLPIQRFYNAIEEDNETRRISINMSGEDAREKQLPHHPKANTLDLLMHRSIQKAAWTEDPLRLCIVEDQELPVAQPEELDQESLEFQSLMPFSQEEMLPYTFKMKSNAAYDQLMSQLYIVMGHNQWLRQHSPLSDESTMVFDQEYLDLAFELPFATAALIPPTPPPKEITTTPACPPPIILPVEAYSDIYDWDQDTAQPWLYTREEESHYDQSLMTSSPRASTSVFYSEDDEHHQQQEVAEESWEAIFHPLSTFKHNKGELEYYAWNSVNLPVAAALVAQRVTNPTSHSMDDMSASVSQATLVEATIPQIMPTPPLKPSPVLTILLAEDEQELEISNSEATLVNNHHEAASSSCEKLVEDGYYYDMLQKIRGSNASSLDESRSTLQSTDGSVLDKVENQHTNQDSHAHKSFKRHALAAALVLGGFNRHKQTNTNNITSPSTATSLATAHNAYAMDDEKPLDMADPETLLMEKPRYWTEKRLFWTGFVCPLLWYYGSFHMKATSSRLLEPSDLRWQKRCRLAALYFSIVLSVVILVTSVKAAGSAGVRQTQTDTIRAVIAD